MDRAVAQFGSALAWGARGRKFESCRPDHAPFSRSSHTERNKDTLSHSDLRAIYKELGFEEWSGAMIKDILNPPS